MPQNDETWIRAKLLDTDITAPDLLSPAALEQLLLGLSGHSVSLEVAGPIVGRVMMAKVNPETNSVDAVVAIHSEFLADALRHPEVSMSAKTAGLPISWAQAEARFKQDHDRGKLSLNFTGKVWYSSSPEHDARDYAALKETALQGLEFKDMGQAEAFFGGFYTGVAVARIEGHSRQARALKTEQRRLAHKFWSALTQRLGHPRVATAPLRDALLGLKDDIFKLTGENINKETPDIEG